MWFKQKEFYIQSYILLHKTWPLGSGKSQAKGHNLNKPDRGWLDSNTSTYQNSELWVEKIFKLFHLCCHKNQISSGNRTGLVELDVFGVKNIPNNICQLLTISLGCDFVSRKCWWYWTDTRWSQKLTIHTMSSGELKMPKWKLYFYSAA